MRKYIKVGVWIGDSRDDDFLWGELKDTLQQQLESKLNFKWSVGRDGLKSFYHRHKLTFDYKGSNRCKEIVEELR